jgi:multidrug efflux pump subunit AcrA (membrane-fusion protein)
LQTEIDVANPDGVLTPGTYCEVELQIPRETASFIVPSEAVIFNRNGLNGRAAARLGKLTMAIDLTR